MIAVASLIMVDGLEPSSTIILFLAFTVIVVIDTDVENLLRRKSRSRRLGRIMFGG